MANNNLFEEHKPLVTVVMIKSRTGEMFQEARKSILRQSYPYIEFYIIDNMDKIRSIGNCWNEGVQKAHGKYVFFMGDDDILSPDYIASLVTTVELSSNKNKVGVTSCITAFDGREFKQIKSYPTGMFKREYVLKYPFDELLPRKVDTRYYDAMQARGDDVALAMWHFGYFYRQHDGMVSGNNRIMKQDKEV